MSCHKYLHASKPVLRGTGKRQKLQKSVCARPKGFVLRRSLNITASFNSFRYSNRRSNKLSSYSRHNLYTFSTEDNQTAAAPRKSQVNAAPKASEGASASEAGLVPVNFRVKLETNYGDQVFVVGSSSELGEWKMNQGLKLTWGQGHVWSATVDVPANQGMEFKCVVIRVDGSNYWQGGVNTQLRPVTAGANTMVMADIQDFNQPAKILVHGEEKEVKKEVKQEAENVEQNSETSSESTTKGAATQGDEDEDEDATEDGSTEAKNSLREISPQIVGVRTEIVSSEGGLASAGASVSVTEPESVPKGRIPVPKMNKSIETYKEKVRSSRDEGEQDLEQQEEQTVDHGVSITAMDGAADDVAVGASADVSNNGVTVSATDGVAVASTDGVADGAATTRFLVFLALLLAGGAAYFLTNDPETAQSMISETSQKVNAMKSEIPNQVKGAVSEKVTSMKVAEIPEQLKGAVATIADNYLPKKF